MITIQENNQSNVMTEYWNNIYDHHSDTTITASSSSSS